MTSESVTKLFDTIAPRFGDRNGGYLRIVRTAWRKGDPDAVDSLAQLQLRRLGLR